MKFTWLFGCLICIAFAFANLLAGDTQNVATWSAASIVISSVCGSRK